MSAKWKKNKKLKPEIILEKISNSASMRNDNSIGFNSFDYFEHVPALFSMVDFGVELDWSTKNKLISIAITESIKNGQLLRTDLLENINMQLREFLNTKDVEYYFLTTLSIQEPLPLKLINCLNCSIRLFAGSYPKKYSSRSLLEKDWHYDYPHTPNGYCKVVAKCKAKSPSEAVRKALNAIDYVRAVICLFSNNRMQISLGHEQSPINKVRLGGMHTLHKNNGMNAVNYFWYEPNFVLVAPYKTNKDSFSPFKKNVLYLLKTAEVSKYYSTIRDCMLRYVRALDEKDATICVIKLWGALESLASPKKASYDLIVRRCSFLYKEHRYHRQMLEHLRELRNSNIHSGEEATDARISCYQLQMYIFRLIIFHIGNSGEFESLEEANTFLDLPVSRKELMRRKWAVNKAIQFVS